MTFEEIHDNIIAGKAAVSLDEIEESIGKLIHYGDKTAAMIAVRLAESRQFFKSGGWAKWAAEKFRFQNKNTMHHRRQVGDMLLEVKALEYRSYARLMELEITKLEAMTEIHINKGAQAIISFITIYAVEEMTREEIRAKRDELLEKIAIGAAAKQLELPGFEQSLEALLEADEEQFLSMTFRADFNQVKALEMTYSGVNLCKASVTWLAAHGEDLEDDHLAELKADIDQIKSRVDAMYDGRNLNRMALN